MATFFLQFPFIVPFYSLFDVNEVWYVNGHPDGLERGLQYPHVLYIVHNCFPSMHTSIAFAVLLLSLKEKDALFKWTKIIYSVLIIYSTMYLEIHWVVDVIGGLLFAYGIVKLSSYLLEKMPKKLKEKIEVM
jgi:membrane-associated phospholipid phosphatase